MPENSDPKLLLEKADRLRQENSLDAAKDAYLALLAIEPNSGFAIEALISLAEIAFLQNEGQKVPEYHKRIVALFEEQDLHAKELIEELQEAKKSLSSRKRREAIFKAMACKSASSDEYCEMATLLISLEYFKGATELLQKALKLDPKHRKARLKLAHHLHTMGLYEQAINEYGEVYRQDPRDITALWGNLLLLPPVYESEESLCWWRERWRSNIKKFSEHLPLTTAQEIDRAIEAVRYHHNFFLAYQGEDFLADQLLYAALIERITGAKYPQLQAELPKRVLMPGEKIRVGFLSPHFFAHSVFKTHGAWVTKLDRSRFETYAFYLGNQYDFCTEQIESHSDFFFNDFKNFAELIHKIAESKLDVLVYPDIGMHPYSLLLAALRLAPVQCNALGHPVTSGLKSMDYMLSSGLMEPENGQDHYSEKLVLLPNLSSSYPAPSVSVSAKPLELKKRDPNKVIYLNVQNLIKFLPRHDSLYPQLCLRVPNAEFHFIGTYKSGVSSCFHKRIKAAFQAYGLDSEKYCIFHTNQLYESFMGLLKHADIVLDCLDWSGFNTTMDAIWCDKPVVTMPGSTCRSRHSSAILQMLGCPELIAKTKEEYIEIAASLSDQAMRKSVVEKIQKNKMRIYDDMAPIKALEEFLVQCCKPDTFYSQGLTTER